jgi:hypothetical protein
LPAYSTPRDGTHRDRRMTMQENDKQAKTRETISLSALMLTIMISNVAVLLFLGPYT